MRHILTYNEAESMILYNILKFALSAALIVCISEVAKRHSLLGAALASLPLVSIFAMVWLYIDTQNVQAIAVLSRDIFWLVLPSLVLFISLPIFLRWVPFYFALLISCLLTSLAYFITLLLLRVLA